MTDQTELPVELDRQTMREFFPAFGDIQEQLSGSVPVRTFYLPTHATFSIVFIEYFMADQPNYLLPNGGYGASRSNWTYHTALAMAQASRLM